MVALLAVLSPSRGLAFNNSDTYVGTQCLQDLLVSAEVRRLPAPTAGVLLPIVNPSAQEGQLSAPPAAPPFVAGWTTTTGTVRIIYPSGSGANDHVFALGGVLPFDPVGGEPTVAEQVLPLPSDSEYGIDSGKAFACFGAWMSPGPSL